jgi:hypothetical protein
MIRTKCPHCAQAVTVERLPADGVVPCGACGKRIRLRVPTATPAAPKAAIAPRGAPPHARPAPPPAIEDDDEVLEEAVLIEDGPAAAPPRKKPKFAPLDDDDDQLSEGPPPKKAKFAPLGDVEDELDEPLEDEAPRKKRRKKKKKKKETGPPVKGSHIAMVLGGIAFVLVTTLGLWWVLTREGKPPPNPDEVIAEITKMNGSVERDKTTNEVVVVNLQGTEAAGTILGKLTAFPKLHTLNLSGSKFADVHADYLPDLKNLRILRLGSTKLTDGGMEPIGTMKSLEDLDLSNTLVTDRGLDMLKGLTGLKKLSIANTPLASGLGLKAALPGLEITD